MLGVDFDDLELTAGGLNHFSCLLEAKYKASGLDAYGDIREKARSYYKTTPSGGDYFAHAVKMGEFIPVEGERKNGKNEENLFDNSFVDFFFDNPFCLHRRCR